MVFAFIEHIANEAPLIGHIKGGIHYICGDERKGDEAMKASSRSTALLLGSVGGFMTGGAVAAVAGGVAFGAAFDGYFWHRDNAQERQYDYRYHQENYRFRQKNY